MKMYLLSDNVDTLTGLRLAGVEGSIIHKKEELLTALETILSDSDIGIVLVNENISKIYFDILDKFKTQHRLPLFVDIPDRHGTGRKPNFITNYVNEAIGLKL